MKSIFELIEEQLDGDLKEKPKPRPARDYETEQWMDQQRSWHAADHAAWQRQARAEYQERQRQAAPVAEAYDTGGFWIAAGAVGAILLILLGLALVLS